MNPLNKSEFLREYGFPQEWEAWALYPDELFHRQFKLVSTDLERQPDEHLRYSAFIWWVQKQRDLPRETLIQLCRLAALDSDPAMAGAAVHDILLHPMSDEEIVSAAAEIAASHTGWASWRPELSKKALFGAILERGRKLWAERELVWRLANDLRNPQMDESEIRAIYTGGIPLLLRGLAEHPNLPNDLLIQLSQLHSGQFAKIIRSLAVQRIAGKKLAPTGYSEKYSTDPWTLFTRGKHAKTEQVSHINPRAHEQN